MTYAQHLTLQGRGSRVVALFNCSRTGECPNDENQFKAGTATRLRVVSLILGVHEKDAEKWNPCSPYLEPTLVSLGEKPKACRAYYVARELGKIVP